MFQLYTSLKKHMHSRKVNKNDSTEQNIPSNLCLNLQSLNCPVERSIKDQKNFICLTSLRQCSMRENSVGPKETTYEIQLNFITCSVKCELIFLQAFMSDC